MQPFLTYVRLTFIWALRDRLFIAVLGVALLLILLVPAFSLFSMRQVQELAVTLTLSSISFVLLILSILLGSSSIWRDIERRYSASVLTLPISRNSYVLGKFCGISLFIALSGVLLALAGAVVVALISAKYPSDTPIHWVNIALAITADILKYILLAAIAMFFSALSTSLFLPMFGSIAVFIAGSGSQEVFEYVSSQYGKSLAPSTVTLIKGAYYALPNFTAFNLKVHAIYGLAQSTSGLLLTALYFIVFTFIALSGCILVFSRRQLS
jgi:ABC-type transport system involved in multi-copper enzyme maturation permease subunit